MIFNYIMFDSNDNFVKWQKDNPLYKIYSIIPIHNLSHATGTEEGSATKLINYDTQLGHQIFVTYNILKSVMKIRFGGGKEYFESPNPPTGAELYKLFKVKRGCYLHKELLVIIENNDEMIILEGNERFHSSEK